MVWMRAKWVQVWPYAAVGGAFALLTGALAPTTEEKYVGTIGLLFLLATLLAAARWGYVVGFVAAVAGNLLLNFFFVEPLHTFTVAEPAHVVELIIFLAVAFVGAFMLSRLREQAARARAHEAETAFLLDVSRQVVRASTPAQALGRLCEVAARTVGARGCAILLGDPLNVSAATIDQRSNVPPTRDERAVAAEALRRAEAGWLRGEHTLTFVPLPGPVPAVLRLEGRIEPAMTANPRFAGVLNEIQSALDRSRLSAEAQRAEELSRTDAFKSLLLSSASHDLRTPLTAIKAAISSLRDDSVEWATEDREAFLETIDTQADVLSGTLANLFEVSRLEAGTARATPEPIEVAQLLAEAALASSGATKGRDVQQCARDGLWVRADYGLLMEALKNLIENAAKYSRAGQPIRLEAAEAPGRVLLRVADAGPPIANEDLPHLFEKFYRGRSGGGAKGSGLGLALVKAIVELAQGSVSVTANEDGNAITLSLPRAAPPA